MSINKTQVSVACFPLPGNSSSTVVKIGLGSNKVNASKKLGLHLIEVKLKIDDSGNMPAVPMLAMYIKSFG
jgi:hypothetical protein